MRRDEKTVAHKFAAQYCGSVSTHSHSLRSVLYYSMGELNGDGNEVGVPAAVASVSGHIDVWKDSSYLCRTTRNDGLGGEQESEHGKDGRKEKNFTIVYTLPLLTL